MPNPKERQLLALRSAEEKLYNLDDRSATKLANLYDAARREVVTALMDWYAKMGSPDTPEELRIIANQVYRIQGLNEAIAKLNQDATTHLRDVLPQAMEAGFEQAQRDVTNMARFLKVDVSKEMAFAKFDPQLATTTEAFVSRIDGLVNPLRDTLISELQYSLVQGDSFPQIVQRLAGKDLGAQGASFFQRGATSMELFSRRAVIDSNNASRQLVYEKAQEAIPKMQKQAVAAIDERTTDCCLKVHGQIRNLDEPYDLRGTPRFADQMMFPAFHWRCRTSSVAYHPAYEEAAAGTEAATSVMKDKAQKQIEANKGKAPAPRPPLVESPVKPPPKSLVTRGARTVRGVPSRGTTYRGPIQFLGEGKDDVSFVERMKRDVQTALKAHPQTIVDAIPRIKMISGDKDWVDWLTTEFPHHYSPAKAKTVVGMRLRGSGEIVLRVKNKTFDQATLDHEVGHSVYFKSDNQVEWDIRYKNDKGFDRHTWYASTNSQEGFAETYMAYLARQRIGQGVDEIEPEWHSFAVVKDVLAGVNK